MKKRINFTGRAKLGLECARIRIIEPARAGEPRAFAAELALPSDLAARPGASVYVEPYVKSTSMRFPFGTVGKITQPVNTLLTELDPGSVLFRVKVVDETPGVGRILAAADRIRPQDDLQNGESRRSLLPLVQRDLGEQVWMVDITSGARPVLVINNRIPAIRDRLMSDPIMQGAIFPHAVYAVFEALLTNDEIDDDEEWVGDWRQFGFELLGREIPMDLDTDEEAEQIDRLISEIVETFSEARAFARKVRESEEESL